MRINKKLIFLLLSLVLIFVVLTFFDLPKNSSQPVGTYNSLLSEIYTGSEIEIFNDENHFKIDGVDTHVKKIMVGTHELLLIVETKDATDSRLGPEESIYRFYTVGSNPKLIKEVNSLVPPLDSTQVLEQNFFEKDINGDGVEELFIKVEMASQVTSYEILSFGNNSLPNITLENSESNWIDFDDIDYRDGVVMLTWHGPVSDYKLGRNDYFWEEYTLKLVRSFVFKYQNMQNGNTSCYVLFKLPKEKDFYPIAEEKENCGNTLHDFDKYLQLPMVKDNAGSLFDPITAKYLGDYYYQDDMYVYFDKKPIADISSLPMNPFEDAAGYLKTLVPEDENKLIEAIIDLYYEMTLFYRKAISKSSLEKSIEETIFEKFFTTFSSSSYENISVLYPVFRSAFVVPDSQVFKVDFPSPLGAGIGGEIISKKFIDESTIQVYTKYSMQAYLGASADECKESTAVIDKFIFKKINGEWKISELYLRFDSWLEEKYVEPNKSCETVNNDKYEKYL